MIQGQVISTYNQNIFILQVMFIYAKYYTQQSKQDI